MLAQTYKTKPGARPFTAPKLLWKTFLRRCDSTPAAVADVVYTGAGSYLYQLDSGGRTLWATETGSQQSSPALDDRRVYIGSDRGILYALNRRTGQAAWRYAPGGTNTFLTPPTLGGGRVYVEGTDNNVYAVDAATGTLRWKFTRPDGSLGYAAPRYTRDSLLACGESNLYCLNPATGEERWRVVVGGKSLASPALGGRRLFTGGDGSGLNAFSEAGKRLWTFPGAAEADWFGQPLYTGGTVYAGTYQRYVYAVDAVTGKRKWSARITGPALPAPVLDAARNALYVATQTFRGNATLWALDARTGRTLWSFKGGSINKSPAILGDRLYAGSLDGYLYAFALK